MVGPVAAKPVIVSLPKSAVKTKLSFVRLVAVIDSVV